MITTDPIRCREWLEDRIGLKTHPETVFIGVDNGGTLATVVAFSHYVPDTDIHVSLAHESKGFGSRELIRAVMRYVFDQLNCVRCTAKIAEDNAPSIKLAKRLGFKAEGRLRRGFGNRDALLFGLLRDELPWLAPVNPLPHPIPTP